MVFRLSVRQSKAYGMDVRSKGSLRSFAAWRRVCTRSSIPSVPSFKRLGVIGDWDRPYLTLTHDYEAAQIEIFSEMAKKVTSTRVKPVYWCPHDETAIG